MSEKRKNRTGLTLVEMMISVALTLMVVFAVVRVFETLGASVTDGRATIEMSGNLRSAAQLLQSDLAGATTTTLPPRKVSQGEGYLEIGDGPGTDSAYPIYNSTDLLRLNNPNNGMIDKLDADGFLDGNTYDTCVGDVDDYLALTSHREEEPFTGVISDPRIRRVTASLPGEFFYLEERDINGTPNDPTDDSVVPVPTQILEARDAEIVWWLQVERNPQSIGPNGPFDVNLYYLSENAGNPKLQIDYASYADRDVATGDPLLYPNNATPVRSLHRRVLLILPNIDLSGVILRSAAQVDQFLSNNDISVRVIRGVDENNTPIWRVFPNSLADLTKRENRAYRPTWLAENEKQRTLLRNTQLLAVRTNGVTLDPQSQLLRQAAMKNMVVSHPRYTVEVNGLPQQTQPRIVTMLRKGRDVVLNDVLGFDLQLWDPAAYVRSTAEGDIVVPSDPGYMLPSNENVSQGAFVDPGFGYPPKVLGGATNQTLPFAYQGNFGGAPLVKSRLLVNGTLFNGRQVATYCTWSDSYEHDGFNNKYASNNPPFDLGYNGLDDDGVNGVDDPGERETSPPYPHPLLGIKATLRTMDFGTRQVRQTSIVQDFLAE